jgi:hypothetical protein
MTVAELIAMLTAMPPDAVVLLNTFTLNAVVGVVRPEPDPADPAAVVVLLDVDPD